MNFRDEILKIAKGCDLNIRQRVKLRMVLRFIPDKLAQEIFDQAAAEGVLPKTATIDGSVEGVDWEALAEFIKEVLPVILEVIRLFL